MFYIRKLFWKFSQKKTYRETTPSESLFSKFAEHLRVTSAIRFKVLQICLLHYLSQILCNIEKRSNNKTWGNLLFPKVELCNLCLFAISRIIKKYNFCYLDNTTYENISFVPFDVLDLTKPTFNYKTYNKNAIKMPWKLHRP